MDEDVLEEVVQVSRFLMFAMEEIRLQTVDEINEEKENSALRYDNETGVTGLFQDFWNVVESEECSGCFKNPLRSDVFELYFRIMDPSLNLPQFKCMILEAPLMKQREIDPLTIFRVQSVPTAEEHFNQLRRRKSSKIFKEVRDGMLLDDINLKKERKKDSKRLKEKRRIPCTLR